MTGVNAAFDSSLTRAGVLSRDEAYVGIESTGLPLSAYATITIFGIWDDTGYVFFAEPLNSVVDITTLGCYTFLPLHPFPEVNSNFAPTLSVPATDSLLLML